MPLYEITTISVFRHKYIIEANTSDEACAAIVSEHPEELIQIHLEEVVTSKRKIYPEEFDDILEQAKQQSHEKGGIDNAHLGRKIIFQTKQTKA
jgi:hypothetical protein